MDQDGGSRDSVNGDDMVHAAFLQRAVDALEPLFGSSVGERLANRLRGDALRLFLSPTVSTSTLPPRAGVFGEAVRGPSRPRDVTRAVSLEDASGLLLAIDAALGDGSGSTLERVGQALGAHTFVAFQHDVDHTELADMATWTRRLTTALLAPFPADSVIWKAMDRSDGLEFVCHVPGHPGCARVLRHLTVGQVRAAFTFAMEATSEELRIAAESLGDRFTITARYRAAPVKLDEYATPPSTIRPLPWSGYPSNANPSALPPPPAMPTGLRPGSIPPPGFGAAGSSPLGSGHLGSGHLGSGHLGSGHLGSGHLGSGHLGSGHLGSGHLGQSPGQGSTRPTHPPTRSGRSSASRPSVADHVNEILRRPKKR